MLSRYTWPLLAALLHAVSASAAPVARFTARPVQGPTCVAPCAVHFDAIGDGSNETTDPFYDREFHSLFFQWNFGDPGSGSWAVPKLPSRSRNQAVGAIAGHLYANPGSYPVTLTVRNPAGEVATATTTVVVADPNAHFGSARTWCFADLSGRGGNFAGCPLDTNLDGSCDGVNASHCVNTADFDLAMSGTAPNVGCNAQNAAARCLFRRGDRFTQSATPQLDPASGPGLISAFGAGAPPVVVAGAPTFVRLDDHWTVSGMRVEGGTIVFNVGSEARNLTVNDIDAVGHTDACFVTQTAPDASFADLIGIFDLRCDHAPPPPNADSLPLPLSGIFVRADRVLVMGGFLDNNEWGQFNFRSVHLRWSVIQHVRMEAPHPGTRRNNIQIRSWHADHVAPPAAPTEWWIVSDNSLSHRRSHNVIRTCQTTGCGAPTSGPASENRNGIIERNLFFHTATGGETKQNGIDLQGGDITVRNNVLDYQGIVETSPGIDRLVFHAPAYAGTTSNDRIHVFHNTLYYDEPLSRGLRLCDGNTGTGHQCKNNLAYAPNISGVREIDGGTGWSSANNLVNPSSSPFAGPVPQQEATQVGHFAPAAANASVVDAGYAFSPSADRGQFVYDAINGCRSAATAYDLGAHELQSVDCATGSVPTLAPPMLLDPGL
jgi:PKD repeat protein